MKKLFLLLFMPILLLSAPLKQYTFGAFKILEATEKKPAHTAVLIMCPSEGKIDLKNHRDCRWELGKKVWEQYMHSHPDVDCYFLQSARLREGTSEQTWIEGDTIYVGEAVYEEGPISLAKTIGAVEKLLPNYTHFFRTNVNAFVNLKLLHEYAETHHQSMFTGPLWQQPFWYLLGYGLLFTADVATHIVNEYRRLEGSYIVSHYVPEDLALTSLATGIFPYYDYIKEHKLYQGFQKPDLIFTGFPALPPGVHQLMCGASFSTIRLALYGVQLFPMTSVEEAIYYSNAGMSTAILYRIRSGLDLDKLAEVYTHLLNSIYPGSLKCDLVKYAESFPGRIYDNS